MHNNLDSSILLSILVQVKVLSLLIGGVSPAGSLLKYATLLTIMGVTGVKSLRIRVNDFCAH